MNALQSFLSAFQKRQMSGLSTQMELGRIDQSLRVPFLLFGISAIFWLLLGTIFALIASITLNSPDLFPNWEFMTFGRIRSAHLNAVAYGWSANIGFAVALWTMARLSRVPIKDFGVLTIAAIFWNIGVTFGILAILKGYSTSVEWLEFPPSFAALLAISFAMIGIWGILAFRHRRSEHVYVSQWYIMAAFFWLPWLYIVAQAMILWVPARGTVQAITNWWFGHNALGLFFTPLAVASTYYMLPKVLGKPIHSYYLSVIGFWTLAIFYNWAGVHHLVGGPIPAWLISAGIVGSVMMVIPVLVTAINNHLTSMGSFGAIWRSPTLRFVVFGAMMYTLSSLFGSAMALREVNKITHFTHFTVGHAHHGLYAFYTMVMFGAVYFIMPRILYREWPSAVLISVHFWCAAIGITLMVTVLQIGGWIQGMEMNNPDIAFLDVVKNTQIWLLLRSFSGIMLAVGHIAFAVNFFWMLFSTKTINQEGPTLLGKSRDQDKTEALAS
jgi:cytochrome c oxidase cbb3-type subunit 1